MLLRAPRPPLPQVNPKLFLTSAIKIFVNYFQLTALAKNIDMQWPAEMTQLFAIQERFSSPSLQVGVGGAIMLLGSLQVGVGGAVMLLGSLQVGVGGAIMLLGSLQVDEYSSVLPLTVLFRNYRTDLLCGLRLEAQPGPWPEHVL